VGLGEEGEEGEGGREGGLDDEERKRGREEERKRGREEEGVYV